MNNNGRKYMLWLPVTAALFLVIGIWTGHYLTRTDRSEVALDKIDRVFDIIHNNYVDEIDFDSLVELTVPQLLRNLDPHSVYIPASERTAVNSELEGSFFGIGIQFQMLNDTLYIVEVIAGAAADDAGLLPGDKIIAVDGRNIAGTGITTDEVFGMLRGPRDTPVHVTVKRHNSPRPLDFDLIRGEVPVSPVDAAYMLTDTIGYIRLGKFSDNTYEEFLRAYMSLKFNGATALVLDLRGNGGGFMAPAVLMANDLMGSQERLIVSTRGRNSSDNRVLVSDRSGAFGDDDLVILIDEFTASASEILAGAVQDNDRGLIIGRRSFGKGLVQTSFELPDSSEFRLTVQRYYTPSGRSIQKQYAPGHNGEYETEVYNRYSNGEIFSQDSIHIDSTEIFHTVAGRPVYGGGGIMPDVFVPSDTSGVTGYYIRVANEGIIRDYAYDYADRNRDRLADVGSVSELLENIPADNILLHDFTAYAAGRGVAPRWYYINISAPLIVNQLKALIARDILGMDGYFEIVNSVDPAVIEAVSRIESGEAASVGFNNSDSDE